MRIYFVILFIIVFAEQSTSQTPSGTMVNPTYTEFNVIDCFKTITFNSIFSADSIKENSILKGYTIWRTISLENKNNQ